MPLCQTAINLKTMLFSTYIRYMNIDILAPEELELLRQLIADAQHIIICGHKSPDGDALGSSLAWCDYLKNQCGKQPTVVMPDAYPDFLRWLPNSDRIVRYDKHQEEVKQLFQKADLVFCLDFGSTGRVDEMQSVLEASPAKRVMVDHHTNADMDTVLSISRTDASSTSELIFRIIWQLGGFERMTCQGAVPIYCGMMTDTGGFTYNSSRPDIFFIISQLLTKGFDKDKIYRNVYNNYSQWAIRLRGYMMSQKLNVFEDFHASYFAISRSDMRDFHFVKGDAEGLVNVPLSIKGMKLSVSLREDDRKDNLVWVSLRSVDDFPCNEMAAKFFNGGGHVNASGGRLYCSLDEAEKVVRQAFIHYEDRLKRK